jgi:predicted TIM-barrel fold metal-dependent hydrolase
MSMLDINVAIGRFAIPIGASFDSASDLLREMDRLGIGDALVYHAVAAEADIRLGNQMLLDAIKGHDRLHPCWVMAPQYLQDLPNPHDWVSEAKRAGVKAVRVFPKYHLYTLEALGPLLAALANAITPILFDFGARHWSERAIPWDDIVQLANKTRRISFVVIGATVGDVRDVHTALAYTENVFIECSTLIHPDLYEEFGAIGKLDRLLFGTGLPKRAAECSVGQAKLSSPDALAKDGIFGANAAAIFGIRIKPDPEADPDRYEVDSLCPVIDMHCHCGSWERTTTPIKGPYAFVKSMNRCGIDKIVFSSFTAIHGETKTGNREAAEWVRKFPDRLFGYCVINPNYPDEVAGELAHCFEHAENFVGLKFHCQLHGAQLHDPGYERALAFASERKLPVLVHGGGQDRWDEMGQKFPGANFIMAHACAWDGRDPVGRQLYLRAKDNPNIYVDLSGSPAHHHSVAALVDLIGAEKIIYGSDFPMFDFGFEVCRISLSELSDADKRKILSENALRICHFPA